MLEWLLVVGGAYALHRANLINLDYPLRQLMRWRRGSARLPAEPKSGLFGPEAAQEAERLEAAYPLAEWRACSGRQGYAESLFYLQMLERAFAAADVRLPPVVSAVDVGAGNWFYVQALRALLLAYGAERPREVALDGVELDAYRVYQDFHSRHDWARAYTEGLPGVRYLPQDIRRYDRRVDLAFMLFPFLFAADLDRWGLPRRYLRPAALLAHVAGLVRPGGYLVIANQGAHERDEQHRLLAEQGLAIAWSGRHDSPLYAYTPERHVTVVRI